MTTSVNLWSGRALVVAPLGRVGMHAHAADALLLGTNGTFRVRASGRDWQRTRAAHVPARLRHELDCGQVQMMVLYLAPGRGDARQLCARWDLSPTEIALGKQCPAGPMAELARAVIAGTIDRGDLSSATDRLAGGPEPSSLLGPDREDRVDRLAARVLRDPADRGVLAREAARASISTSRLRHLFQERTGVSLRELRRWQRMRAVSRHVAAGARLTDAALEERFADSAQLSRDFRATFGIPPSRVLGAGARILDHSAT